MQKKKKIIKCHSLASLLKGMVVFYLFFFPPPHCTSQPQDLLVLTGSLYPLTPTTRFVCPSLPVSSNLTSLICSLYLWVCLFEFHIEVRSYGTVLWLVCLAYCLWSLSVLLQMEGFPFLWLKKYIFLYTFIYWWAHRWLLYLGHCK